MSSRARLVTTYVPQRPDGVHAQRSAPPHARRLATLSWRRTAAACVRDDDGRDAAVNVVRCALLLLHAKLSSRRRQLSPISPLLLLLLFQPRTRRLALRRLLVFSEALAGVRRALLIMRWAAVPVAAHDDDPKAEAPEGDDAEEGQQQAIDSWRQTMAARLDDVAAALGTTADAAELAAFAGGTSVAWRLRAGIRGRSRLGLERIGVILSLIAQVITLVRLQLCMRLCRAQLSRANRRLIAATDMLDVSGPAASAGLLRGRRLSVFEAMGKQPLPDSASSSRSASPDSVSSSCSSATAKGAPRSRAEPLLRAAEADIGRLRREMRQLRLERLSVLPETVFAALEIFGRGQDWTVMEGWCGVLSSLATLARVGAAAEEH